MAILAKISLWSAVAVAMTGVLTGVVWQPGPAKEVLKPPVQERLGLSQPFRKPKTRLAVRGGAGRTA